jgi:hypothetical protein
MIIKPPLIGIVLASWLGISVLVGCAEITPKAGRLRCDDHSDCPSNWYCAEDRLCYPQEDTGGTNTETDTDMSTDTGTRENGETDTGTETGSDTDTGLSTESETEQDAGPDSDSEDDTASVVDTNPDSDAGDAGN